ncbi:MAG: Gfo/Idh/MocA family oxidoreductase [Verrucomicrobia bacterium]|nr:Gfo/Idh/MocA family oxidoreductase [Verrucomicrobiota bacterium]
MKKENRLLRVGVLGAGLIAQAAHLEACRKARNVELHALCDAAPDLLGKVAAAFEPKKTFGDYDAMLADENVEAVIVAIADQFHVPMAIRAVEAGKHVLVEKPMGVNVAECERLRDAVRARPGIHLQVGTMRRFDPGIAFAHDFIRDQLGELLALKAWYCDSIYRYQETDNLHPLIISSQQARRPAGNPKADRFSYHLLGHGSHLVDTARYLGGELLAVRTDYRQKFDAHSWFVSVEFANGALGHLDLTLPVRMEWHEGFQVYGEHGSVVARSVNPWYFRVAEVECFSTRDGQYHRPVGADGHIFRRQIENFADVILHGAHPVGAQVEDGVAALRALSAISHSCRTGRRVLLAEAPGEV